MLNVTMDDSLKESVRKNIRSDASLNAGYLWMNTLATVIACSGIFTGNTVFILGAMVVAMLVSPIAGIALALVDSDMALLRKALLTLLAGMTGIFITAFVLGLIHRDVPIAEDLVAHASPNLFDLIVALAGGAAGAYATVSPSKSVAFIGMAIATSLVPPLALSSILLARGEDHLALGAFYVTCTNIVGIQFSFSAVLWFMGIRRITIIKRHTLATFLKRNAVSILILAGLLTTFSINLQKVIVKEVYENEVHKILLREINTSAGSHVIGIHFQTISGKSIIRVVVRGPNPPSPSQVDNMETKLPAPPNADLNELRIRFVRTEIIGRDGPLYDGAEFGSEE